MEKIEIEDYGKGILISERDDTLTVEFAYPRQNKIKYIEVGICDVRAADNIRIHYDFDRDGYVLEQAYINEIDMGDYIDAATNIWEEVGFFESWSLEHKGSKLKKYE